MSKTHRDETIFTGGRIFNESCTVSDNLSVLTSDGVVVEIAPINTFQRTATGAQIINLQESLLLPGLCDAHIHLEAGGNSLGILNLLGMNLDQISTAFNLQSKQQSTDTSWFRAFNWEPSRCSVTIDLLDMYFQNRPIVVHQRDLHGLCCNSLALNLAGITITSEDPDGGHIGRNADGSLNGLLYENAIPLVESVIPIPSNSDRKQHILTAQSKLLSLGLTAVSEVLEAGADEIYRKLDSSGELKLFVDAWQRIEHWEPGTRPPADGTRYQLRTLKAFLDGSFGSRTAAVNEPYLDGDNNSGLLFYSDQELWDMVVGAQDAGWRMALHAIGDRAIEQACRVLCSIPNRAQYRHRLEHVEMLPPKLVQRLADSGMTASVQPVHLLDDQLWLESCIGTERCKTVLPLSSISDHKIPLAFGSDFPVVDPDPLLNIHTAINRCGFGESARKEFAPDEGLNTANALLACTQGYAHAADLETVRGAIKVGQTADFTVVSGVADDLVDWSKAEVRMTVCGGVVV
jgi:predicted amidohydrolase YtcJ